MKIYNFGGECRKSENCKCCICTVQGETGATGATGPQGATGATGESGTNSFASFVAFQIPLVQGELIPFFTAVEDPQGNIVENGNTIITLQSGYYLVSYKVSAIFTSANYMQVTPSFNSAAHLEYGIYFATSTNGSSATGSAHFIISAPAETQFTLTYSGSADARAGEVNITFLKLNS